MWLKSTPAIKFIWLILSTIKQNSDDIVLDKSKFCYFLIICFSQGSVATSCRYGGKYDTSLVANLRMSPTVKIFENWSTFLKVMNEYQVAHFFMAHSVDHVCQRDTAIWKVWHHPHSTQTSTQSYKIFCFNSYKNKARAWCNGNVPFVCSFVYLSPTRTDSGRGLSCWPLGLFDSIHHGLRSTVFKVLNFQIVAENEYWLLSCEYWVHCPKQVQLLMFDINFEKRGQIFKILSPSDL